MAEEELRSTAPQAAEQTGSKPAGASTRRKKRSSAAAAGEGGSVSTSSAPDGAPSPKGEGKAPGKGGSEPLEDPSTAASAGPPKDSGGCAWIESNSPPETSTLSGEAASSAPDGAEEGRSAEEDGCRVYIGPTIRGRVQYGAVFSSVREARQVLAAEQEVWPMLAGLLVPLEELAGARAEVKTPGTARYVTAARVRAGLTRK